ncbi:TIGR04104 family putative zinc finger protein [Bacillus massiliglaciei]|uniref:TIGR04104 family putative zinc finger protein n=1 Tax=Bacillus massiliglaciei TaxID=1816693 RepID=UPI000DA6036D|nr:TIGR04104 family putative zinc finger protein [Bacillus massiliglaciei]
MLTCQNCNKCWNWKQTQKAGFVLDTGMTCPYCRKKQYLTPKSRKRLLLSNVMILLPLLLPLFNYSPLISLSLIFVLGIAVLLFYPFYNVSNEETTWRKK